MSAVPLIRQPFGLPPSPEGKAKGVRNRRWAPFIDFALPFNFHGCAYIQCPVADVKGRWHLGEGQSYSLVYFAIFRAAVAWEIPSSFATATVVLFRA